MNNRYLLVPANRKGEMLKWLSSDIDEGIEDKEPTLERWGMTVRGNAYKKIRVIESELERRKPINDIVELITRRRRQVLVHSCIYYRFGTSIIDDYKFDEWAYELVDLQEKYPAESKQAELYDIFEDFDGSTGYHLPLGDPWLMMLARHLIDNHRRKTNGGNSE